MKSKTATYENVAEAPKYRVLVVMKTKVDRQNLCRRGKQIEKELVWSRRHILHGEGAFYREHVPCTHLQAVWTAERSKQTNGELGKISEGKKKHLLAYPLSLSQSVFVLLISSTLRSSLLAVSPTATSPRFLSRGKFSGLP